MKLIKRILYIAAAALLCGCGQTKSYTADTGAEADVKLSFFGYKADALNLTAIEDCLGNFMDEHPDIEIVYEGLKGNVYWDAFDKRLETGNVDDIIMIDHDRLLEMSSEGKLADLSDLAGIDNFTELMRGQIQNDDGSVYFLPLCISAHGFYCNLDLLAEYGQAVPTNYEELAEVCDFFVSEGITPIIVNNYDSLLTTVIAKGMYSVYQSDDSAEIINQFNSGEKNIAEQLLPGLELVQTFIDRGWIDREEALVTNLTSDDIALFAEGNHPFMITGGWASPRVEALKPDFDFMIYPYPVLEDGSVLVATANTCISVSAESEHTEEAKAFAEFVIQKDVIWEYCDSQSSFTPLYDDRLPSDSHVAPMFEYLTNGRSVIGADYNITLPLDSSLRQVTLDMLGGMSAEDAAAELETLLYSD